jgi:TRAP-type mannitol/chloroaromatic compound transport system permease small subunit
MNAVASPNAIQMNSPSSLKSLIRFFSYFIIAIILFYLASRYLIYWHDFPSLALFFQSLTGTENELSDTQKSKCFGLLIATVLIFFFIIFMAKKGAIKNLSYDAERFKRWSYYLIRAAFWAVFLVGTADALISLLRVENFLIPLVGQEISDTLGLASKRGYYVHYPLIILALIIAFFTRSLGFIWLSFLVVLAEFTIVLTRFIFSYEQAYMGDLVRFWYASLFLFASAYTLMEGGHVRVDVLYARMGNRKKAWVNAIGSVLLGLPVCWAILHYGVGSPQSSLIAPILSYEVSQSGYGMYVKYLMGGFLIIYAVSMAFAFVSVFLNSCAYLLNEENAELPSGGELDSLLQEGEA